MDPLAVRAYLRAGVRRVPSVGDFLITFDQHSDNPYRNYAVPGTDAAPDAAGIARLVAWFAARDRMPRLEYVSPAPELEAALSAAGFTVEGRLPLMAVGPDGLVEPPTPAGVEIVMATDAGDLSRAATVQNAAYGDGAGASQADVDRLARTVGNGGGVVLAVTEAGEAVGSGLFSPARDGLTEIAAVGVLAGHRRRGVATALCHRLTVAVRAAGATPFLMTEAEPERRAYARIGYRVFGELGIASRRVLPAQPIPGPRLTLRPVGPAEARAVRAGDVAGAVTAMARDVRPDAAADLVAGTVSGDGWPHPDTADGLGLVVDRGASCWLAVDDGVIVGEAGTHGPVDATGRVEIGYGLAKPYRGRGLGAELVSTLSRWLLWQPAVREVVAVVPDGNVPSRRVLERAGFVAGDTGPEGRLYTLSGRLRTTDQAAAGAPEQPVDHRPPTVVGGELDTLLAFLGYLRECLLAKCQGLSERDARHSPVPSGTSLLGLVRHVAAVEVLWLHHTFAGYDPLVIPDDQLADSDTVESVTAHYRAVAAVSDGIVRGCADAEQVTAVAPFGPPRATLRWILVHLVEEVGRHAGHADILREQLDGRVGR